MNHQIRKRAFYWRRPRIAFARDLFRYPRAYARGNARNFAHCAVGDRFRACIVVGIAGQHAARLTPRRLLAGGHLCRPFTPGFVGDPGLASQLAEIGVILLMFGVGLHFSIKDLLSVKNIAVPGACSPLQASSMHGW
jgi:hypothetical protein